MIKGLGIDIVKINRIESLINRWGDRFLDRIFTIRELEYCSKKNAENQCFSARFAAKEAALKMLGSGLRQLNWQEIEVRNNQEGKPEIFLKGKARIKAERMGIDKIYLSLSHEKEYAIAQ